MSSGYHEKYRVAFSYVPSSTARCVREIYGSEGKAQARRVDPRINGQLLAFAGYLPFMVTGSHVVDSWKLVDHFVPLWTRRVLDWTYVHPSGFPYYNLLATAPFLGISDCIGYSNYHFRASSVELQQPRLERKTTSAPAAPTSKCGPPPARCVE